MVYFIHQYSALVETPDGTLSVARAYAAQQEEPGGLWEAWFVFFPIGGGGPVVTDRETTQSKLEDVLYWVSGIEPIYLEGALTRALERLPSALLARRVREGEATLYAAASAETLAPPPSEPRPHTSRVA
jgi:hypothetical protein